MDSQDFGRFCAESLYFAAKHYNLLGFSVIPVNGACDPARPKLPPIKWGRYQHIRSDEAELADWFLDRQYGGLGIVCGRVSRLVVLDFDDGQHASEFRRFAPDLADTFEVRSGGRGLPHFYWRVPDEMIVSSRSFGGVDLRGEGSYVVAAPTRIPSGCWQVVNQVEPRLISESDLRRVLRFLSGLTTVAAGTCVERSSGSSASGAVAGGDASEFRRIQSVDELVGVYRGLAQRGRNNALFYAACVARDSGWQREGVVLALASVHAEQPGSSRESYRQRYAEAVRTIASAFSRPPRRWVPGVAGLGNVVRELLLQRGMASVARVLDGLYAAGLKAGQCFTERMACELLAAFRIGRRSVMVALRADAIFRCVSSDACPPLNPPQAANAASDPENLKDSCELSRGAKRVKSGRPACQYVLPSAAEVAEKLGVKNSPGDALQPEDLSSPKAYRQALHRELLKRRPGQYPRQWLGARIGASRWTTRRYEAALNVHVQPMYSQENLRWSNIQSRLPETKDDAVPGTFIEDASGKRYPPLRAIAARLLKRGEVVCLKRREANYYAYGQVTSVGIPTHLPECKPAENTTVATEYISSPPRVASVSPTPEPRCVGIPTHLDERLSFWYCPHCLNHHIQESPPTTCRRCGVAGSWERLPAAVWQETESLKTWWQNSWRERRRANRRDTALPGKQKIPALEPEAEALAQQAHRQAHDLSLRNAHRLVSQYGLEAVGRGLTLLKTRRGIRSPAAFLVTVLKSEYKLTINNSIIYTRRDGTRDYRDWVQRMAASPYADFLANKDDLDRSNMQEFSHSH
jgi:hypothetical protein